MAYSKGDLKREVHSQISTVLGLGHRIVEGWLIHNVLSRHPLTVGPEREFNDYCRREAVSRAVRAVLRDLKLAEEDPEVIAGSGTMLLPGYKHLQLGYPFKNDEGQIEIVPIVRMTAAQKRARADLYDRMAIGCQEHAEELRRHADLHPDLSAA